MDCDIVCGNFGFLCFCVVRSGRISEILCFWVVTIVSTISSFTKCDGG